MGSRQKRGRESERALALWMRRWFPWCEPVGASSPGADLTGTPGVTFEIKSHATFRPLEWMRQARRNAGKQLPVVVFRANGQGVQSIPDWFAIVPLGEFMPLLADAGYAADSATEMSEEQAVAEALARVLRGAQEGI